ncbi:CPBP family intramembrane metalloprotease [Clostridium perfringens]|nr:CPBP family intramembrane metalloprotease [Clostridium perfringens]
MNLSKNNAVKLIRSLFSLFLIYIGVQFLAVFVALPFMLVFSLLLKQNLFDESSSSLHYLILDCAVQIVSIYFFAKIYREKDFNITKIDNHMSLKTLGKYALISLGASGISVLWIFLVEFLSNYSPFIKNSLESFIERTSIFNGEPILAFISVVILAPIVEELIFRGVVFNEVAKYKGGALPIIVSALLFGLAHREPVQIVYTFIGGLIFGFVYSKTHSLPIVMFLHMLNNLLTTFPPSISTFIDGIQIICIIPMAYLLSKLYKKNTV